jgi:peptide chain release factor subunit 1
VFVVEGDRAEEVEEFEDDVPGRHDQGGWSQSRYQRHIEEHVHRHLKRTAEVLRAVQGRRPFDHLVLGGAEELVAVLERELHSYLARRIVARASMPITASAAQVVATCQEREREREARREVEALSRLVSEVEARTGRAVAGLPDTLAALEAGRVDTLVVDALFHAEGVRCPACGHLDLREGLCAACGTETVAVERLEEVTIEEALRRRCRVETVGSAPSLDALGRIGALLRF